MTDQYDYTGSQTIVYDVDKKAVLAKTKIYEHQRNTRVITLKRTAFPQGEAPEHVSLLIIHNVGVYEYKGTVRKLGRGAEYLEIALYKGQEKEARNAARYTVNTPAVVENIVMVGKLVPLATPTEITVCNISTQGCLIQGGISFFNIDTTFQIKLLTGGDPILMYATVVRIVSEKGGVGQFGCAFTGPEGRRLSTSQSAK